MHPKIVALVLAIGSTAACSHFHTTRPVTLSNGDTGYRLKCRHPGECEQRAEKVCPHGYSVVDSESQPGKTQVVRCHGGNVDHLDD